MLEKPPKPGIEAGRPEAGRRVWTGKEKKRVVDLWRLIDVDDENGVSELSDVLTQAITESNPDLPVGEIERIHDELFAAVDDANTTAAMDDRLPFERVERILLLANEISARRNKKILL